MTFEEWYEQVYLKTFIAPGNVAPKSVLRSVYQAATAAMKERCAKVAEEGVIGFIGSVIGEEFVQDTIRAVRPKIAAAIRELPDD